MFSLLTATDKCGDAGRVAIVMAVVRVVDGAGAFGRIKTTRGDCGGELACLSAPLPRELRNLWAFRSMLPPVS